jgi:hypothetical protein
MTMETSELYLNAGAFAIFLLVCLGLIVCGPRRPKVPEPAQARALEDNGADWHDRTLITDRVES